MGGLGESYQIAKDREREAERLGAALNRIPGDPRGLSLLDQVQYALDWWNRVTYSYMATAEGQGNILLVKADKDTIEQFKKHYDTEDAKKYRYHNLAAFQPMGRAIYAAVQIGPDAFEYLAPTGGVKQTAAKLGKRVAEDLRFDQPHLLERIRGHYNDDRGYEQWIKKYGELAVDIPVGMVVDLANPLFAGVGAANRAKNLLRYRRLWKEVSAAPSLDKTLATVATKMEGAAADRGLVTSLHAKVRAGDRAGFEQLATAAGLQPRTFLTDLADYLPNSFRRAGEFSSPAALKFYRQDKEWVGRIDELWAAKAKQDKGLSNALGKLDIDEFQQFIKYIDVPRSQRPAAIRQAIASGANPPTREVYEALAKHNKAIDFDYISRAEDWPKQFQRKAAAIDEALRKSGGKLTPEVQEVVRRMTANAPPAMREYVVKVIGSAPPGQLPDVAGHARRFELKRVDNLNALGAELATHPDDLARQMYVKRMSEITSRPASVAKEARIEDLVGGASDAMQEFRRMPDAAFGGAAGKNKVLDQLQGVVDFGEKLRKATPEEKSILLKGYDTYLRSLKQGWLFFTPGFYLQNLTDNTVKNVIAMGPKQFSRWATNLSAVDGSTLNFVRTFQGFEGKGPKALLDLPGFKQYVTPVVDDLMGRIESSSRNFLGSFVYHNTVDELRRAGFQGSVKELHRQAFERANRAVQKVQFLNEDMSAAAVWLDRVVPFSSSFRLPNLSFWAGQLLENPVQGATLLRLREHIKAQSIDGTGKLRFLNSKYRIDPFSLISFEKAAQALDNTKSMLPQDTAVGNIVRAAKVMDSLGGAFAGDIGSLPAFSPALMVRDVLKGRLPPFTQDPPDFETERERTDAMNRIGRFIGPADIASRLAWRTPFDRLSLPEGDVAAKSRVNLELAAAAKDGRPLADGDAEEMVRQNYRTEGAFRLFGIRGDELAEGSRAELKFKRDVYNTTPDAWNRAVLLNKWPEIKRLVHQIPFEHPQKQEIEEIANTVDPVKRLEKFREKSDEAREGIFENIGTYLIDGWRNLRSKLDEELSHVGVGEAHAAEMSDEFVEWMRKGGAARQALSPAALVEFLPNASRKFGGEPVLPVGLLMPTGQYQWFTDKALGIGEFGNLAGTPEARKFQDGNRILSSRFEKMQTRVVNAKSGAEIKAILDDPRHAHFVELVDYDGAKVRRGFATIQEASAIGSATEANLLEAKKLFDNAEIRMFRDVLLTGDPPLHVRIAEEKAKGASNQVLWRGLNVLNAASNGVKQHGINAPHPGLALREIGRMMRKGELPADFFEKAWDSGDVKMMTAIRDFAVSEDFFGASGVYSKLFERNPRTGRIGVSSRRVQTQFIVDENKVRLAALFDKRVASALEDLDEPNDVALVGALSTESFLESLPGAMRVPVTRERVLNSKGILSPLSDGGAFDDVDVEDRPAPGAPAARPPQVPDGKEITVPEQAPIEISAPPVLAPPLDLGAYKLRRIRQIQLEDAPSRYSSISHYLQDTSTRTIRANRRIQEFNETHDLRGSNAIQTYDYFGVAADALPSLPPQAMASGAESIMRIGHFAGWVDDGSMQTIRMGLAQASLTDAAGQVAINALSVASAFRSSQVQAQAAVVPADVAAEFGMTSSEATEFMAAEGARGTLSPGALSAMSAGGALLSMGSGFAAAQDQPELAQGLGAAGGALQGAVIGTQFSPGLGTVVGAAIGAAVGFFSSRGSGGKKRQAGIDFEKNRAAQLALIQEQRAEIRERAAERQGFSLQRRRRLLVQAAVREPRRFQEDERLTRFFRRPTFQSSMDLVSDVERRAAARFVPRF